jgi:heme a synthase
MGEFSKNRWLNRFAIFSAVATWFLIGLGGLVTSHEAGMAVPDWPTTYGYNMFLFPPSQWIGGILYEHSHRLLASFVGLLTTILAIWLWLTEDRRWLRWLGVAAFLAVVLQGILGGLRVKLMIDQLGIFHAALAHVFLVLLCFIALVTSRAWEPVRFTGWSVPGATVSLIWIATGLIFTQLVLGASMRHQHAGLAVPDFPLAYGQLWPSTDEVFLEKINRERIDPLEPNPIRASHIHLHMTHRLGALTALSVVVALAWRTRRSVMGTAPVRRYAMGLLVLMVIQAGFGAWTVWSNKAADVATVHVLLGATGLVAASLTGVLSARSGFLARIGSSRAPFVRNVGVKINGENLAANTL